MSETTTKINRRKVLKMTGVSSLGASFSANPISGRQTRTDIIKVGVKYIHSCREDVVKFHTDSPPKYFRVDEDEVRLTPHATRNEKLLINNNSEVLVDGVFQTVPTTIRKSTEIKTLPTALAGDFRTSERVALTKPHQNPRITIRNPEGRVELHVHETRSTAIGPGETVEYQLPSEVVHVETIRRGDAHDGTDGTSVDMEYGERAIEVVPTVVMRYIENLHVTEQ